MLIFNLIEVLPQTIQVAQEGGTKVRLCLCMWNDRRRVLAHVRRPPPLGGPLSLTLPSALRPSHNAQATLKPRGASGSFFTALLKNAREQSHN